MSDEYISQGKKFKKNNEKNQLNNETNTSDYSKEVEINDNNLTSSGTMLEYIDKFLFGNIDIVGPNLEKINMITNPTIQKEVIKILRIFQEALLSINVWMYGLVHSFPPLNINELDDSSVLIEWNFKDIRAGFSIESEIDKSTWYIVTSKLHKEESYSGYIKDTDIKEIIKFMTVFVAAKA